MNDRLIPARAGKTKKGNQTFIVTPAHPRACGENALILLSMLK